MIYPDNVPRNIKRCLFFTLIVVCGLLLAVGADAVDLTASMRMLGTYSSNPDQEQLFPNSDDASIGWVFRGILKGGIGSDIDYELNLVSDLSYATAPAVSGAFQTGGDVAPQYRYPELTHVWRDPEDSDDKLRGVIAVDRLNIKWVTGNQEFVAGRKPINLTACYLLTPNDFFQPFSPEAFNRIYKPGVDTVQLRSYIGNQAEISVIGVAGYDETRFDWNASALLARSVFAGLGFEWTLLAGALAERDVIAASAQGDLTYAGIRAEFNYSFPDNDPDSEESYLQFAAGLDKRWTNSFHIIIEYMYRGNGSSDINSHTLNTDQNYIGKNYIALSTSYEWHPLVVSDISAIVNPDDHSMLITGVLHYSLSDESDFIIGGIVGIGEEPGSNTLPNGLEVPVLRSEYGSYPDSFFTELRFYF